MISKYQQALKSRPEAACDRFRSVELYVRGNGPGVLIECLKGRDHVVVDLCRSSVAYLQRHFFQGCSEICLVH